MNKIKLVKQIRNHIHFIGLIILLSASILAVNFYSTYKNNQIESIQKTLGNIYLKKTAYSIIENLKPRYKTIDFKIEYGDTFEKILNELDVPKNEKKKVLKKVSKFKFINNLYKNQKISFKVDRQNPVRILEFSVERSKTKTIKFTHNTKIDNFEYTEIEKNLTKIITHKEAEISNSLYSAAIDIDIQPNVIIDFAKIYGFQIDFQRDIWKNDSFQIIYQTYLDSNNKIIETGNILFANLNLHI